MVKIRRPIEIPASQAACEELQRQLSFEVLGASKFTVVGGVRVHYLDNERRIRAWAVALSPTTWTVIEKHQVDMDVTLPRWEGCEGFREGPAMLAALEKLRNVPDVLFVHGAGRAHIRRFGLACHVGVATDLPTIGVEMMWPQACEGIAGGARSKKRGSRVSLAHGVTRQVVGFELRTQPHQDPLYVSPGHRLSEDEAAAYTLRACLHYRLPEPLRQATDR